MKEKITQKEICDMFDISRTTLWRWTNKKTDGIPHFKIHRTIRYNKHEVQDWFEQHKINGDRRTKGVSNV